MTPHGTHYDIHQDTKYQPLTTIDVPALIAACKEEWHNQTLCRVNESAIRLGIFHGEFHWHKHDVEDEFFFVLEGTLLIDLEGQTVALHQHQGYTIPHGVVHRTRAPERACVLMVEPATVTPTGD